jgi:hypothetical protein
MDLIPDPDFCAPPVPYGLTIAGRAAVLCETKGDPLGPFPSLVIEGRAYNLWLTERVLDFVLARWSGPARGDPGPAAAVAEDIEWGCGRGRRAFQEILPAAAGLGDPAILVAMGVTANLQRTLALLAEMILDDRLPPCPLPPLRLSRLLCGLVDYPARSPYFPARMHPPVHAASLRSRRADLRYLGNALWCSEREINRCCDEALAVLGREIRLNGEFTPGDLRHLHALSAPRPFR